MKKIKLPIIAILTFLIIFSLCACTSNKPSNDTGVAVIYHTVSFDTANGTPLPSIRVVDGGLAQIPQVPTREGYIFDYWSFDGKEWSFGFDKVTSDITLTAQWIEASTVFSYTPIEGREGEACITGVLRQLESLEVPSVIKGLKVVAIGEEVFAETSSETTQKITVADTVTSIGKNAFRDCEDVEIVINGALTEVGETAFLNCSALKKITLGEGMTKISPQAFDNCTALAELTLPSTLEEIGENAFTDCISITQIKLPVSLKLIGDGAFIGCDSLQNVYFDGTEKQFKAIDIKGQNIELTSATIHYTKG